jgi:hypothetical protein
MIPQLVAHRKYTPNELMELLFTEFIIHVQVKRRVKVGELEPEVIHFNCCLAPEKRRKSGLHFENVEQEDLALAKF